MSQHKRILVTAALPYANGPIHLGHLVGYIQADIWVRFQQLRGHECHYVCGSDAHGTPIMLKAEQLGIPATQLVQQVQEEHQRDFARFQIKFDNFYTTHSQENKALAEEIFHALEANGDITVRTIEQAYDSVKEMFLPDRYVRGECPRCGAADQYGDNCEVCGATYNPTDLKNPISVLSNTTPIKKSSEHYFFCLQNYRDSLKKWTHGDHLQPEIRNKLEEWFAAGLQEWDISRDAPYFGFQIPGKKNKYFYVWLDAPIGYMASFKNYCAKHPELEFADFWRDSKKTELYHFIGKDIVYFHSLFWPAILTSAGYRTPTAIFANGFLTINGQKMSKSRGTFITAAHYLEHLPAEYLRYYYAAKLNSHVEDLDINFQDFMNRINSDLVGKVVNIASRCSKFINSHFDNTLSEKLANPNLFEEFVAAGETIAACFEAREFARGIREITALADKANQYIDHEKPWKLIKESAQEQAVQEICSTGLNCFRIIMTYLKPILPTVATEVEHFLNIMPLTWP